MGAGQQRLEDMKRLDISPDLIKAYLINLAKTCLLIGALAGSMYLVKYIAGENPLASILDDIGVPFIWVTRAAMAAIGLMLVLTIFNTLTLTSYELVFEGDRLKYSYGNFIKVTKETDIVNTIRVNYNEYSPLKLGEIIVGFTDTDQPNLRVQYVDDVKYQCDLVNKLINLKRAQQVQKIEETGVVE
ncbi:MAG: hypothetical protein ABIA62_01205, partial [Candidatus Woesearchaeota archaeon]